VQPPRTKLSDTRTASVGSETLFPPAGCERTGRSHAHRHPPTRVVHTFCARPQRHARLVAQAAPRRGRTGASTADVVDVALRTLRLRLCGCVCLHSKGGWRRGCVWGCGVWVSLCVYVSRRGEVGKGKGRGSSAASCGCSVRTGYELVCEPCGWVLRVICVCCVYACEFPS